MTENKVFLLFIGAIIGYLLQQYRVAKSEDLAIINDHIKDIEKFNSLAYEYWTSNNEDPTKDAILEQKLIGAHYPIAVLYSKILNFCARHHYEYKYLNLKLYNLTLGEPFGSPNKGMDTERATEINEMCSKMIHCLRETRADTLTLTTMINRCISFPFKPVNKPWLDWERTK